MSLFIVTHRHSADRCPASDPSKGPYLLKRLSQESAEAHGIKIHAEAMADGLHSLNLILEAEDQEQVQKFMAPFAQGGSVSVLPASPCEVVVDRGRC
ncbi:MAG: DUF3303 domain-containing protein [Dehalococcoidia bacterium]